MNVTTAFFFVLAVFFMKPCHAHGLMNYPNPRGGMSTRSMFIPDGIDPDAPIDYLMHFPAGDRSTRIDLAGLRSQMAAADKRGWIPFEPLETNFRWRSGVCGDTVDGDDHLKGGKYYNNAKIAANYTQGQVIEIGLSIVAHHNGFMELHVCDVEKCPGGKISQACFRLGHCKSLKRAPNQFCDSGYSKKCGPIDPNYPGRWYLPCSEFELTNTKGWDSYKKSTILYELPKYLLCKHCVMQWYWTAANSCNPPGIIDYFTGENRPRNWGTCQGQGGAVGGFSFVQGDCGGRRFPEEYLQCADIRISKPENGGSRAEASAPPVKATATPSPSIVKSPKASAMTSPDLYGSAKATAEPSVLAEPRNSGNRAPSPMIVPTVGEAYDGQRSLLPIRPIYDIVLIGDGKRIASVMTLEKVNISKYKEISVEVIAGESVRYVKFFLSNRVARDDDAPYYIFGDENGHPNAWISPPLNRVIELVVTDGSSWSWASFTLES